MVGGAGLLLTFSKVTGKPLGEQVVFNCGKSNVDGMSFFRHLSQRECVGRVIARVRMR